MVRQLTACLSGETHNLSGRIDGCHLFAGADVGVEMRAAHVARVAAFATPASGLAGDDKSLEKPATLSRITGQ
jgi:hypothetical protein